ncbi:MAG: hypothetical protein LJE83_10250 [Gammaproteobacteria bacterium]|jgi:hypothetical protein|nr:hypothetical protein [Gammaproteobacteria bacterium]
MDIQQSNFDARHWLYINRDFERPFKNLMAAAFHVRKACEYLGKNWTHGIRQCEQIFSSR